MKKSTLITITAAAAVVLVIVIRLSSNSKTIEKRTEEAVQSQIFDAIPVKIAPVRQQEISNQITMSGSFVPQQELKLAAQSQGQITSLKVKKSQIIMKGTLIATIDNSSLQSQLISAQATLDKAKQDAQRYHNALQSGGVTQIQVEDAELKVKNALAQVAQLQQQAQNYRIVAPMSGIVNDVFIEQGSFVSPGNPIVEIVDLTQVNLKIRINQESLPDIRANQPVKVTTDVYPGKIFDGHVETVNVKTDVSQKIEVGVTVKNSIETPLLGGMYGHAEFMTQDEARTDTVLMIPREAIIGSTQDAKVFVQMADSTVTLKSIQTGRMVGNSIEVLNGLSLNELVVTAGQINLVEGKRVTVKNN